MAGLVDLGEEGLFTEYVPPVTVEEEEMVAQWQAVLETDRDIGMNDNFYDLGGHSIRAMALAAVLDCDVRLIVAHPTPASLLAHLQASRSSCCENIFSSLEEVSELTKFDVAPESITNHLLSILRVHLLLFVFTIGCFFGIMLICSISSFSSSVSSLSGAQ